MIQEVSGGVLNSAHMIAKRCWSLGQLYVLSLLLFFPVLVDEKSPAVISTTIMRATARETGTFRHHGYQLRTLLNTQVYYGNMVPRGLRGALNSALSIPKGVNFSDANNKKSS